MRQRKQQSAGTAVREAHSARHRLAVTVTDQALSSLSNFLFAYIVLRSVVLSEYGVFTLLYATYLLLLGLSRSLTSEILAMRHSARDAGTQAVAGTGAVSASLLVGAALAAALMVLSALAPTEWRVPVLAVAVTLPLLLGQDTLRYYFFVADRPGSALFSDATWLVALVAALGLLHFSGSLTLSACFWSWGLSGSLASLIGLGLARLRPGIQSGLHWLKSEREHAGRISLEFLVDRGASQAALWLVGAFAGLYGLGALNAARTAFGPVNIFFLAATSFGVPEASRTLATAPSRFVSVLVRFSVFLFLIGIVTGFVLLLIPVELARIVFTPDWKDVRPLLIPTAAIIASAGWLYGARIGFRAMLKTQDSLRLQSACSALLLVTVAATAAAWGALGAAYGMALSSIVAAALWWRDLNFSVSRTLGSALTDRHTPSAETGRPNGRT